MGRITELLERTPTEVIEELKRLEKVTDDGGVEVTRIEGSDGRLRRISIISRPGNLTAELFAEAAIREIANGN